MQNWDLTLAVHDFLTSQFATVGSGSGLKKHKGKDESDVTFIDVMSYYLSKQNMLSFLWQVFAKCYNDDGNELSTIIRCLKVFERQVV